MIFSIVINQPNFAYANSSINAVVYTTASYPIAASFPYFTLQFFEKPFSLILKVGNQKDLYELIRLRMLSKNNKQSGKNAEPVKNIAQGGGHVKQI
jgi:hypothetical protein